MQALVGLAYSLFTHLVVKTKCVNCLVCKLPITIVGFSKVLITELCHCNVLGSLFSGFTQAEFLVLYLLWHA